MSCPKCGSEDWKTAEFMYKSGFSEINTKTGTVGAAAGVSSGGTGAGIGVSTAKTSGNHQNKLSAESSPPEKPKDNQGTVYWVIAIVISIIVSDKNEVLALIIFLGAYFYWSTSLKDLLTEDYKSRVKEYKKDLAKWNATRVCQRCGESYVSDTPSPNS